MCFIQVSVYKEINVELFWKRPRIQKRKKSKDTFVDKKKGLTLRLNFTAFLISQKVFTLEQKHVEIR